MGTIRRHAVQVELLSDCNDPELDREIIDEAIRFALQARGLIIETLMITEVPA